MPRAKLEPSVLRAQLGLTLIEVMVALVIVAIALATGMKASGALTNNAQRLSTVTSAQWCADNELLSLRLSRTFPSVGDSDFDCEELGVMYRGHLVVRPTPNPNFRRVEARLADADGQSILAVVTIVAQY